MRTKSGQLWIKRMTRKEQRLQQKREVEDSLYAYTPTHKQKKEMSETCLYEQALSKWYEIGGTSRYHWKQKLTSRKQERSR